MNVVHLIPLIGPESGGLGPVALNLTLEQRDLHQKSVIWTLGSDEEAMATAKEYNLSTEAILSFPTLGPISTGYSVQMQKAIVSEMGNEIDILHQHGIWTGISRVSNSWRRTFKRPTILAAHGSLEKYALQRSVWKKRLALLAYERENLFSATCLHATSQQELLSLRDYGLKAPIAVIPNGVSDIWVQASGDAKLFYDQFSISSDRRIALFLSRIHPKKGIPLLLRAIAALKPYLNNWIFIIAGPDEIGHKLELEVMIQDLRIEHAVKFVGPIFGHNKIHAYAAAQLFVLPTHSENFGIVVAEALGSGVPVLTTRGAPWHELESYNCGWWADITLSSIEASLREAISLSEKELRIMGENGRLLVRQKYTWRRMAEMTHQLYYWLLGKDVCPDFVNYERTSQIR